MKAEIHKQDNLKYSRLRPHCLNSAKEMKKLKKGERKQSSNLVPLKRNKELSRFVLDDLLREGEKMGAEHLTRYEQCKDFDRQTGRPGDWRDKELTAVYLSASAIAENPVFKSDFELLGDHIQGRIEKWQGLAARFSRPQHGRDAASSAKTRRAEWDELARSFAAGPENLPPDSPLAALGVVERLRASWAYEKNPKFAWSVAFLTLCHLKASAHEPVAVAGEFADMFSISGGVGRVLEQSRLARCAAVGGPPRA